MDLSPLAGNQVLKKRLQGGTLSHAYIVEGPVGSGRHTLVRLLCGAMLCEQEGEGCGICGPCRKLLAHNHPDVITLGDPRRKGPISVDLVREIGVSAYIPPNEGRRKIYLLEEGDQMSFSAQNAMLKLLEDGPSYVTFFFIVEQAEGLLPTIQSRCQTLRLSPLSPQEVQQWLAQRYPQEDPQRLIQAGLRSEGILGRGVAWLSQPEPLEDLASRGNRMLEAMLSGDELALWKEGMAVEGWDSGGLIALLDWLEKGLIQQLSICPTSRRYLQGLSVLHHLRQAIPLHIQGGQLMGWLCAGMFEEMG